MKAERPDSSRRAALALHVAGVVQGVGFRPFVYRLAHRHGLCGWVQNDADGVAIHVEGPVDGLRAFVDALHIESPPGASIASVKTASAQPEGLEAFVIAPSFEGPAPTSRIPPDLPVCTACLDELLDPAERRYGYPYITCTDCGPRYSLILDLPYDRPRTTMRAWSMCQDCAGEYHDPLNRRFHAQPLACPTCGPTYFLREGEKSTARGAEAIARAARLLNEGAILAVKGLGGYHLACDAHHAAAVRALRARKFRKEKPFALMVADVATAGTLVHLTSETEALLTSTARPVTLTPARIALPGIAPDNSDLGVMLPYTPLHHLLFAAGAPPVLVMTSANRSSEPIAYTDADAFARLEGLADAFLVGERPIARRIDDSVARVGPLGVVLMRRSRGYAPGAVACLPGTRPILAVGADLKNTVTLVVDGQAFISQHIGDLTHQAAAEAFGETIHDLLRMYAIDEQNLLIVHDAHPEYVSTQQALMLPGEHRAVQHHRAHIASVLAERQAWDTQVIGVAFDGTGYGDDGSVWGGEVFAGTLAGGLRRVAHLFPALLPGGDAAARHPVQAAAGFLTTLGDLPDLSAAPFAFPERYQQACLLIERSVRTFPTTSVGRLFDTVAALLGFTRAISFEGQAALWLEQQARQASATAAYPFPDLDYRPLLRAVLADRLAGRAVAAISRAFHASLAQGLFLTTQRLATENRADALVLSGGVFQNQVLLEELAARRGKEALPLWINRAVPANDGGISLGQAALGGCSS